MGRGRGLFIEDNSQSDSGWWPPGVSLRMAPDACTAAPRAPHGWLHVQDTCRTPPLLSDVRLHDWNSCKAPQHHTHGWLHASVACAETPRASSINLVLLYVKLHFRGKLRAEETSFFQNAELLNRRASKNVMLPKRPSEQSKTSSNYGRATYSTHMSFDVRSREVSREEEEAREQREMEYRPPKQAISSKVYDLDLNGFTESQLRVVLSAFMILGHPDAVFNSQGDQEAALNDSAKGFLREFKLLIKVIKEGHVKMSVEESKLQMLRSQLDLFDKVWCAFLNSFVLWKFKDTRLLGEDKVRAACQLEISMIQKCKITPEGDRHCAHS
uniref:Uncharacterized protein n=2 Tax=Brassica TaxID=3705 RepID=A0A3P6H9X3_BRAOL|nr:unnamed protein product [Brassica oleracea]